VEKNEYIVRARKELVDIRERISKGEDPSFCLFLFEDALRSLLRLDPDENRRDPVRYRAAIFEEIEPGTTEPDVVKIWIKANVIKARYKLANARAYVAAEAYASASLELLESTITRIMNLDPKKVRSEVLQQIEPGFTDESIAALYTLAAIAEISRIRTSPHIVKTR
jgi:hypothetical protein